MTDQTDVAFFDTLTAQTDSEAKKASLNLAGRKLRRDLAGAADSYAGKTLETEAQIGSIYEGLRKDPTGPFPVERLISLRINMEAQQAMQEAVAAEYKHLFGEDLPSV